MDGFLWGLVSSFVASIAAWSGKLLYSRWNTFSLEDYWIEEVDGKDAGGPSDRTIISLFSYRSIKGSYVYSGTSYTTDGKPEWTWNSPAVVIDHGEQMVYYVYKAWRPDSGEQEHYGFGMMRFEKANSSTKLNFTTGSFRGSLRGQVLHRRRLRRAKDVIKDLKLNRGNLRDPAYRSYLVQGIKAGISPQAKNLSAGSSGD